MKKENIKQLIDDAQVATNHESSDTVKVWEAYKDEALMWRALFLLQIPVTLCAFIVCFLLWNSRVTKIKIPAKPQPGVYTTRNVPDISYIEVATEFVNLVASYQPAIAARQFKEARKYLIEPMLSTFDQDILTDELNAIERTNRTQLFFVDPSRTEINRQGGVVTVTFIGDRLKFIGKRELPLVQSEYRVNLRTIPRNTLNPFGIVITGASSKDIYKAQ